MSFYRYIYICAIIGGWSAFAGWLLSEVLLPSSLPDGILRVILTAAMVGGGIGQGLMLITGSGSLIRLIGIGLLGGILGGAVGGLIGEGLYSYLKLPRFLGWVLMGLCIGSTDGIAELSLKKWRNGLIGGGLGGLIGGILFDPMVRLAASHTGMTGRAMAFVLLGLAIGCLIGLVQVVFREAWLTVLDGYRPGRQLILSKAEILLGRGEWTALPFLGSLGRTLENEHSRIYRDTQGCFYIEDLGTDAGVVLNQRRIEKTERLRDGDVIKLGGNIIRFNEKGESGPRDSAKQEQTTFQEVREDGPVRKPISGAPVAPPPPPPPVKTQGTGPRTEPERVQPTATRVVGTSNPPPPPPPPPPPASPMKKGEPATSPVAASPGEDAVNLCPGCKRKIPGVKGTRYCMVCDLTF